MGRENENKNVKQFLSISIVLLLLIATAVPMKVAAVSDYDPPEFVPKESILETNCGKPVNIEYTLYSDYNQNKAIVQFYNPNGTLVKTINKTFSNTTYYSTDQMISCDTTGLSGAYNVVTKAMYYDWQDKCWYYSPHETELALYLNKLNQSFTVKSTTKTVKYRALKKSKKTVTPLSVKGNKTALSYQKVSGSKKLTINKNTGKVTVKKKTKKGTYKMKVRITAKTSWKYSSAQATATVIVKVKK